jgi:hypothetical protein
MTRGCCDPWVLPQSPMLTGNHAAAHVVTQAKLQQAMTHAIRAVDSAEDPERILTQAFEDMKNDIIRLRQVTAQVRTIAARNPVCASCENFRCPSSRPSFLDQLNCQAEWSPYVQLC